MDTPGGGCGNIPYERINGLGLVEVAACGMGCALIRGEVFRVMHYPHYHYQSALTSAETVSEDVYFCLKARRAGFTVWADETIRCDHKGSTFFQVQQPSLAETVAAQDLLPVKHQTYLKEMDIEPEVIYDIGACVQHWTRHAAARWPQAEFYLIDANEQVRSFLQDRAHAITVLSDADGRLVDFYSDPENFGGNSYYCETTGAFNDSHRTTRVSITLDTLIKQNDWPMPDLIKLDIQGAELDVLRGAPLALAHCQDIILEAQHTEYNRGAPQFETVCSALNEWGFELAATIDRNQHDGDYHFTRHK